MGIYDSPSVKINLFSLLLPVAKILYNILIIIRNQTKKGRITRPLTKEMAMSILTSMLNTKGTSKGTVVMSEENLCDLFTHFQCSTKTSMMVTMHEMGFSNSDIAVTLLEYGILGEKSYRQHVRNTIERCCGS